MGRAALIVGAGIGGLSAAIALRRSGWDVRVFEQAESPRELGFGVGIAPNAVAALRELGAVHGALLEATGNWSSAPCQSRPSRGSSSASTGAPALM